MLDVLCYFGLLCYVIVAIFGSLLLEAMCYF